MKRWYVIEAREGKDRDVYNRLAALGWNVWRPVYAVRAHNRRGGYRTRYYKPVFGRYLFLHCAMTDSAAAAIREVRDVYGFLCGAGSDAPAAVPDEMICEYQQEARKPLFSNESFGVGDVVEIADGAYAGHVVTVTGVDSAGVLRVAIALFGGVFDAPMRRSRVKLVERAPRRKRA